MTQSKELTEFYVEYAKWLDEGAIPGQPFDRYCGLCYSLEMFAERMNYEPHVLGEEMVQQFKTAGLCGGYPFNNGRSFEYVRQSEAMQLHLNPRRIEWVRRHAAI